MVNPHPRPHPGTTTPPPGSAPPRWAGEGRQRRPLISLTPLIDVVFILLVFFMLASSFLDWRAIALDAPAASAAGGSMEGALLLEVRPDGLRLSGAWVAPEGLVARVASKLEARPGRRLLVKPSADVTLQATVDVLDRLAAGGVAKASLVAAPGR